MFQDASLDSVSVVDYDSGQFLVSWKSGKKALGSNSLCYGSIKFRSKAAERSIDED